MAARRHCRLFDDEGAGVTVEFVAIFPAFLLVTFFAFEMIVAMISVGTAEKAAQLGARYAMVSNYVVTTLTSGQTNAAINATTPPGTPCILSGTSKCTAFDSGVVTTCDGGLATSTTNPCSAADFTAIVNRIHSCSTCTGISNLIQSSNVKIQYSYVGLGYAGGPIVPSVTVTIQNVPYGTLVTDILTNFMRFAGNRSRKGSATSPLPTNLPTITVTMTGEDMNSLGAS